MKFIVIGLTKRWLINENAYIDELIDYRTQVFIFHGPQRIDEEYLFIF